MVRQFSCVTAHIIARVYSIKEPTLHVLEYQNINYLSPHDCSRLATLELVGNSL